MLGATVMQRRILFEHSMEFSEKLGELHPLQMCT